MYTLPLNRIAFFLSTLCILILSSCSDDEGDDNETVIPQPNIPTLPALPATVSGQVVDMKFTTAQTGAPYVDNQEVKMTFSSAGQLFIDDDPAANDGDEINIATFTLVGSEYIWQDASNGHAYALSLKPDGSINEVNVSNSASGMFLGQFITIDNNANSLVANYQGNYDVTSVDKGSHSRMTVSIDANGNIDFDSAVQLNSSDFDLVSDRLSCCNGIWIDMKPYPTTPYPRVNLFVDQTSGELNKIEYFPEYSSVNNRVTVNLKKK